MSFEIRARRSIPHGVVFLYDPRLDIDVPPDTGAGPVLSTPTCVTLWTVGEDEGEVDLTLTDKYDGQLSSCIFDGVVRCEGEIALLTSSCEVIVIVPVYSAQVPVSVFANDSRYPDEIIVVVRTDG